MDRAKPAGLVGLVGLVMACKENVHEVVSCTRVVVVAYSLHCTRAVPVFGSIRFWP